MENYMTRRVKMYLDYETYVQLFLEAEEYDNYEMYVAERGWQEWMNAFESEPDSISHILKAVYSLRTMSLQDMRSAAGIPSRVAMSRSYRIPLRTLENWDTEDSTILQHTLLLVSYTIFLKIINKDGKENED